MVKWDHRALSFFAVMENPWQSGKRNNGVLDRLCQTKYYFQKAKKLFKKALTNFSEYDKIKPLTKMRSWKLNRCNCVPMLSAAEHSYFGRSIDSPHKSSDKDSYLIYITYLRHEASFLSEQVLFAFWCFRDSYVINRYESFCFVIRR